MASLKRILHVLREAMNLAFSVATTSQKKILYVQRGAANRAPSTVTTLLKWVFAIDKELVRNLHFIDNETIKDIIGLVGIPRGPWIPIGAHVG